MPSWLGDLIRDWGPATSIIVFVLTGIGGAIAALGRLAYSIFAGGAVISGNRHRAEMAFYETQLRLNAEACDRRIAELMRDVDDLERDRDSWRDRFWRAAEQGQILVRRDTPPHGTPRSEVGQ